MQRPQPGSSCGNRPEQRVGPFMLSPWYGANRFEHLEVTRFDTVPGYERMANGKALCAAATRPSQGARQPSSDQPAGEWAIWV